jgi:hypothetical protein
MWLPMRIDPANFDRNTHYLYALARLKLGISRDQAQSEMNLYRYSASTAVSRNECKEGRQYRSFAQTASGKS